MTFEPGKTYRTRDGREARVYAVDGSGPYCIQGALLEKSGWRPTGWTTAGRYFAWDEESDCDLLPPAPLTSVDEASRYADAWRAGAEAMREAAAQWLDRNVNGMASAMLSAIFTPVPPAPPPPAAPAPETERLSGECWVNVYEGGAVECYRQRSYADNFQSSCGNPRIACIRIDLSQHRKGEGL